MATIVLADNANWSTCNGGSPPAAGDTIALNGFILTLDAGEGAGGNEFTCALIRAFDGVNPTGGSISLGLATTIINANLQAGSTGTFFSIGAGKTVTVNGDVKGGTAAWRYGALVSGGTFSCTTATGNAAVAASTTGVVVTSGSATIGTAAPNSASYGAVGCEITGGSVTITTCNAVGGNSGLVVANGTAIVTNANGSTSGTPSPTFPGAGVTVSGGTCTITTATGGSVVYAVGVFQTGGTLTVTTAIGGSANGAAGLYERGGTATVGSAKGGSVAGAAGIMPLFGTVTINGTDLTGTGPVLGGGTLKIADGVLLQYQDADGNAKKFYGDSEMPDEADVKTGVAYGLTDFTGTYTSGSLVGASALVS